MKIRNKILLSSIWGTVATGLVCVLVSRATLKSQGLQEARTSMRAALVGAEAVRDSFSTMNETDLFQKEHLLQDLNQVKSAKGDVTGTALYQTIPIVAGWRALDTLSKQRGYLLRVAREEARNPKNLPTADEARILEELRQKKGEDYFYVDQKQHEIIYARPIILSKDCLSCHGDPGKSVSGDGKDLFGQKMEGWKTGEMHGAFILKQSTNQIDSYIEESTEKLALVVALVGVIALAVSLWIIGQVVRGFAAIDATIPKGN